MKRTGRRYRTGRAADHYDVIVIGSGIGGLEGIYDAAVTLHERGPRRVSPFFIPACLINLASGNVSIQFGFKGPNHAVVTA
jgi:3-oxoacyl-[acyl-carrier-protein] synthase II